MKLQLAGSGGIADGMYLNELQMGERSGETPSSRAERGGQMKGYEELEQMSLESLLYYVLVGEGRISKQREET